MRDVYSIAAELHIAELQRLLSAPESEIAIKSIVGPWARRDFQECARIIARFPILRVEPVMGAMLGEAMMLFTADLIIRLVDLNLFAAVPTVDDPRLNAWTYAVESNRLDVLRALWAERGKHPINPIELTEALSYAAREAEGSKLVPWLIEVGADLNAVAAEARFKYVHPLTFALYDALKVGTEHTVRALLELGADPNHRNAEGGVPLVWAACYGDVSKVRALLSHDAYAPDETEDPDFWQALDHAPKDCVEEIRRTCRSLDLGKTLRSAMRGESVSSSVDSGELDPL